MITSHDARTYAGLIGASSVVVAKQIPLRNPLLAQVPPRHRPSGLSDVARLFSEDDGTPARRISRLASAALMYSVDKQSTVQPDKILRGTERDELTKLDRHRHDHEKTDRSCPHCRLLYRGLYSESPGVDGRTVERRRQDLPPIAVLNHSAKVRMGFDPETNISEGKIEHFQLLVPGVIAENMLRLSHPLHWSDPADSLFQRSDPVNADGTRGDDLRGARQAVERIWERKASKSEAFVFEDVIWPVNESVNARSENIIRIQDFARDRYSLVYEYFLERCVRTNFGIGWEPSGLDVDGGHFRAHAIPIGEIPDVTNTKIDDGFKIGPIHLGHIRTRDVHEMRGTYDSTAVEALYRGQLVSYESKDALRQGIPGADLDPEKVPPAGIVSAVKELGGRMAEAWSNLKPFYLVDVSASKRLHFTIPENGPIELWQILTWTAPAILFMFLNRGICLGPHLLIDELLRSGAGRGGAYGTAG